MLSTSVIADGFYYQQCSGQKRNRYKDQSRLSKIALQADTIHTLGTELHLPHKYPCINFWAPRHTG